MSQQFSRNLLAMAIASSLLLETMPAMAQLEEIIVTARKREESIMQVPVTSAVISKQSLDQYAIDGVKGIAGKVPGLNFGSSAVSAGVQVSMRGVGTSTFNASNEQSVALVADGVQFTQGIAYKAATFDLAQVEVLKGPQALFFGKAAPGGVISITTADPTDDVEVSLRGGYEFEAEERLGEFIASGPVTDTLGLRFAAEFSDMEGYFRNTATPADHPVLDSLGAAPTKYDDFPNEESLLLRGTAVWEPADNFDARLKVNYNDYESQGNGGDPQYVSCPEGTGSWLGSALVPVFGAPAVELIGGADCKLDDKFQFAYLDPAYFPAGVQNGGIPFQQFEQMFGSLELNYEFGNDLTLTSVTGFYDVDQQSLLNISTTTQYGPLAALQGNLERDDFTEELRLTSDYDGSLNFMLGAFYHDGNSSYLNANSANQAPLYQFFWTRLAGRPSAPLSLGTGRSDVDTEAMAVFGQVLWQMTPELELGVGARGTNEDRSQQFVNLIPTLDGVSDGVSVGLGNPNIGSSNWSPEVSLTYTPTESLTVYGNLKQAYKSGSFNSSGNIQEGEDASFKDERVRGGEIGLKSRLLEDTLAVNASTYFYKYDDMQVEANTFAPGEGVPVVRTINAGASEIYGVDADVTYAVPEVEGLTLFGAVNWNKAEYTEFANAQCWDGQLWTQGCNIDLDGNGIGDAQDLDGAPLLRAPEWTANIGFDYERAVFDGMLLRLGSNVAYSDSYSAGIEDLDTMYQDSYVKTSATMSLIGPEERWSVDLIGDNLTDEIVFGNCVQGTFADAALGRPGTGTNVQGPSGQPEVTCFAERGRSIWLRLTWNLL